MKNTTWTKAEVLFKSISLSAPFALKAAREKRRTSTIPSQTATNPDIRLRWSQKINHSFLVTPQIQWIYLGKFTHHRLSKSRDPMDWPILSKTYSRRLPAAAQGRIWQFPRWSHTAHTSPLDSTVGEPQQ